MHEADRHRKFQELLREGYPWQVYVGNFLRLRGLPVEIPPLEVREKPSTEPYENEKGDLNVGGIIIESKGISQSFYKSGDYPHDTVIVDSVSGWKDKEKRGRLPKAFINVSKYTSSMMWLSVKESRHVWIEERRYFENTNIFQQTFVCDTRLWHPIDELVVTLKAELGIK